MLTTLLPRPTIKSIFNDYLKGDVPNLWNALLYSAVWKSSASAMCHSHCALRSRHIHSVLEEAITTILLPPASYQRHAATSPIMSETWQSAQADWLTACLSERHGVATSWTQIKQTNRQKYLYVKARCWSAILCCTTPPLQKSTTTHTNISGHLEPVQREKAEVRWSEVDMECLSL